MLASPLAPSLGPRPPQEYRRQFNLEPLVKDDSELRETGRVRATVSAQHRAAEGSGSTAELHRGQGCRRPPRPRAQPFPAPLRTLHCARRWMRSVRSAGTRAWSSTRCSCAPQTRGRLCSTNAQTASTSTPPTLDRGRPVNTGYPACPVHYATEGRLGIQDIAAAGGARRTAAWAQRPAQLP
jgi:hypothetical protein